MKVSRRMHMFSLLTLCFCVITLLIHHLTPARGWPMLSHYVMPLIFAFAGAVVMQKEKIRADYIVCAAMLGWYIVSRIVLGENYMETSWQSFCRVAVCYLLAFPFAFGADDVEKKRGLKWAAGIYFGAMTVLVVVGIMAVVLDQSIYLPFVENNHFRLSPWEKRLYGPKHPITTAALFSTALMLGFWLMYTIRKRWIIIPGILMCLCLYTGIGLTVSRTIMVQVALCSGFVGVAFVMHRKAPKVWMKVLACAVAFILLVAAGYFGFSITNNAVGQMTFPAAAAETVENNVVASRPLLEDLATLTGRTGIYKGFLTMLKENPRVLFFGTLEAESSKMLNLYSPFYVDHAHNAYLQVILFMGLPGALIAIYLVIRALWLSFKVVFLQKSTFADKLLAAFTVSLLVITITEPYPFTTSIPLYNFLFFLIFGYLVETEHKLRTQA